MEPLFHKEFPRLGVRLCWSIFFLRLQGNLVNREVDDKAVWMATKGGKFFVKSFYDGMV